METLALNGAVVRHRSSDGYINLTELCKAGNKHFKSWNSLLGTKEFLNILSESTDIPVEVLVEYENSGDNRGTWGHPYVAIEIAHWICPKFKVLVSKWVFELMSTGTVALGQEKKLEAVEAEWRTKVEIQNKQLLDKDREIYRLRRKHNYIAVADFVNSPGLYIISDEEQSLCSDECKKRFKCKIGMDGRDVPRRISEHRTTMPTLRIDLIVYMHEADARLMEKLTLRRYREKLSPFTNHEFVHDVPTEDIIKYVFHQLNILNIDHEVDTRNELYNAHIARIISLYSKPDKHNKIQQLTPETEYVSFTNDLNRLGTEMVKSAPVNISRFASPAAVQEIETDIAPESSHSVLPIINVCSGVKLPTGSGAEYKVPKGQELGRKPADGAPVRSVSNEELLQSKWFREAVVRDTELKRASVNSCEVIPNAIDDVDICPVLISECEQLNDATQEFEQLIVDKAVSVEDSDEDSEEESQTVVEEPTEELLSRTCSICNKILSSRGKLKRHINTVHYKLEKCTCDICNKEFAHKGSLNIHIKSVHNRVGVVCQECGKTVTSNSNLKRHIDAVHNRDKLQCPNCDLQLSTISSLREHVKRLHMPTESHKCEICPDRIFTTARGLNLHMCTMHKKNTVVETEKEVNIHNEEVECPDCGKVISSQGNLRKHISEMHNKVRLQCPQCDAQPTNMSNLRLHIMAVHMTKQIYKCELCPDKTFTTLNGFNYHKSTRHSNFPEHTAGSYDATQLENEDIIEASYAPNLS